MKLSMLQATDDIMPVLFVKLLLRVLYIGCVCKSVTIEASYALFILPKRAFRVPSVRSGVGRVVGHSRQIMAIQGLTMGAQCRFVWGLMPRNAEVLAHLLWRTTTS